VGAVSAALLREAAAKMRERAEAATYTAMPWGVDEIGAVWAQEADGRPVPISSRSTDQNAEHIASWHPAVALAVADWLDDTATANERVGVMFASVLNGRNALNQKALAVARAYLGADA